MKKLMLLRLYLNLQDELYFLLLGLGIPTTPENISEAKELIGKFL
jgi:hypothetical protein